MTAVAWRGRHRTLAAAGRGLVELATVAVAAAATGALAGHRPLLAAVAAGALVSLWLTVRPHPAAIALGASLPALENLGSAGAGVKLSLGDLVLLLVVASALAGAVVSKDGAVFRVLRPVRFPVGQYCVFVLLLLVAHPSKWSTAQTIQRFELVVLPLVAGSYLALRGAHVALLKAYVVGATAVAVAWPFTHLDLQKNPAGQLLANALLLLVGLPQLSRFRILVPVLVFGLFATASRGAILAGLLGLVIVLVLRGVGAPRRTLVTATLLAGVALAVFQLMPANTQSRITDYSTNSSTASGYAAQQRIQYSDAALTLTRKNPWLGVGVGSYLREAERDQLYASDDPHDVVLLQSAEGGWGFAASFVVLVLGSALPLVRRRDDLAHTAVAITLATAAHGLVDVYWVRGTPVLGWLLVGMACAGAARLRSRTAA
ncbi:MAG TPA: O-antigen ligase family protein [Gaiellaceae bacterium]|nr:O-antigen ligase family protein [Gaiellaceae bacterium]